MVVVRIAPFLFLWFVIVGAQATAGSLKLDSRQPQIVVAGHEIDQSTRTVC